MSRYIRTIDELESRATMWWPAELTRREASTSILPMLLQTQDEFISILSLCKEKPGNIFNLIRAATFPANLFLKHLVVLSNVGGEPLERFNKEFDNLFPLNDLSKREFMFFWNGQKYRYEFKELPFKGKANPKLNIDGTGLQIKRPLDNLLIDVIMLLLFGSNTENEATADVLKKCEIGNLLGKQEELKKFVKQRYILVSRITGGAEANTLGQVSEGYVMDYLSSKLGKSYSIKSNGHINGVTHNNGRTLIPFDILVSKGNKSVGIESSFQVTTNSTIERKAGQAKDRYEKVTESGNYIAYIIDGAGNFQRRSAVSTICEYSQCTVAYTDSELDVLVEFIKSKLSPAYKIDEESPSEKSNLSFVAEKNTKTDIFDFGDEKEVVDLFAGTGGLANGLNDIWDTKKKE